MDDTASLEPPASLGEPLAEDRLPATYESHNDAAVRAIEDAYRRGHATLFAAAAASDAACEAALVRTLDTTSRKQRQALERRNRITASLLDDVDAKAAAGTETAAAAFRDAAAARRRAAALAADAVLEGLTAAFDEALEAHDGRTKRHLRWVKGRHTARLEASRDASACEVRDATQLKSALMAEETRKARAGYESRIADSERRRASEGAEWARRARMLEDGQLLLEAKVHQQQHDVASLTEKLGMYEGFSAGGGDEYGGGDDLLWDLLDGDNGGQPLSERQLKVIKGEVIAMRQQLKEAALTKKGDEDRVSALELKAMKLRAGESDAKQTAIATAEKLVDERKRTDKQAALLAERDALIVEMRTQLLEEKKRAHLASTGSRGGGGGSKSSRGSSRGGSRGGRQAPAAAAAAAPPADVQVPQPAAEPASADASLDGGGGDDGKGKRKKRRKRQAGEAEAPSYQDSLMAGLGAAAAGASLDTASELTAAGAAAALEEASLSGAPPALEAPFPSPPVPATGAPLAAAAPAAAPPDGGGYGDAEQFERRDAAHERAVIEELEVELASERTRAAQLLVSAASAERLAEALRQDLAASALMLHERELLVGELTGAARARREENDRLCRELRDARSHRGAHYPDAYQRGASQTTWQLAVPVTNQVLDIAAPVQVAPVHQGDPHLQPTIVAKSLGAALSSGYPLPPSGQAGPPQQLQVAQATANLRSSLRSQIMSAASKPGTAPQAGRARGIQFGAAASRAMASRAALRVPLNKGPVGSLRPSDAGMMRTQSSPSGLTLRQVNGIVT